MAGPELPPSLKAFVASQDWTFAKTYAKTWPHEYLVREKVDEALFMQLARHIVEHGYAGTFYKRDVGYFDEGGYVYWTMYREKSDPPQKDWYPQEDENIVNRCRKEESYEYKRDHGLLPDPPSPRLRRTDGADPEELSPEETKDLQDAVQAEFAKRMNPDRDPPSREVTADSG